MANFYFLWVVVPFVTDFQRVGVNEIIVVVGLFSVLFIKVVFFIIKISDIKSSVKEWIKLSLFLPVFLYQLPKRTWISLQRLITMNDLSFLNIRADALPCCEINLVLAPPCCVAFYRKAIDTLGTKLANHVHLFMTSFFSISGSSLACTCLNSY